MAPSPRSLRRRPPHCWKLPDAVPFADAAAMGLVYQTAHFALVERAQYRMGETVLVTGAGGGVGLAGVQLAKAMAATVLAGVSRPERGRLAREAGADAVIDLGRPDLREASARRRCIARATGGQHGGHRARSRWAAMSFDAAAPRPGLARAAGGDRLRRRAGFPT